MNRDWYISKRAAGDYAVQRVVAGEIDRWGVYPTFAEAQTILRAVTRVVGRKPVRQVATA